MNEVYYSVVGFTHYQKNRPYLSLEVNVIEAKQPGRWALSGWTFTSHDGTGKPEFITKVKVSSFAEDVPIGDNNKYDIVPPEGAKVGRSHEVKPEGEQETKRVEYWYQVKNGKLVQTSGPPEPLWDRVRRNWYWYAATVGIAAVAFAGVRMHWRAGVRPTPPADK